MAKKKLEKNKTSKKLEADGKKSKKRSSRKALAKFAYAELKSEKKVKAKRAKKNALKFSENKSQLKDTSVETSQDNFKFANTDASSWRKMTEDASAPMAIASTPTEIAITKNAMRFSKTSSGLLSTASVLLAIATGIAILFAVVMAVLPGGQDAVPAMGAYLKR